MGFAIKVSNISKKLSQVLELDWIKINSDAFISDKRKIVYFQNKNVTALFLNRIFRIHQIKLFFFVIIRIITRYEFSRLFLVNKTNSNIKTKKQIE
jgi:hypothetical protein